MSKKSSINNFGGIVASSFKANEVNINNGPTDTSSKQADESKHPIFVSFMSEHDALAHFISRVVTNFFPKLSPVFVSSSPDCVAPGADWLAETENALRNATLLIALVCKDSLAKHWINFEIGAAWSQDIPIIFLCYKDMTPDTLPSPYGSRQGLLLSQASAEKSLESMLNAIEKAAKVDRNDGFPTTFFTNELRKELIDITG